MDMNSMPSLVLKSMEGYVDIWRIISKDDIAKSSKF